SLQDDRDRLTQASAIAERLVTFPLVTVAAINGACAGAGLSLALATDIRVAADRAVFNTAFVSAGVSGDLGSAWLLTRAVGNARASSLILDPVKLDAGRALELGLVTEVTADLAGRLGALTAKLANQPLLAMQHAKRNLADAAVSSLPAYLRREVPRMLETAHRGDARAAAQAFVNRRDHQGAQAGANLWPGSRSSSSATTSRRRRPPSCCSTWAPRSSRSSHPRAIRRAPSAPTARASCSRSTGARNRWSWICARSATDASPAIWSVEPT